MIIFTTIKDIPQEYIEMKGIRQVVKFNLSSYFSGDDIIDLNYLSPSPSILKDFVSPDYYDSPEFDTNYYNYILQDKSAFFQFMTLIYYEYIDPTNLIQILIDDSGCIRQSISESLMKFIQQRYGICSYYVFTLEDFMYIEMPSVGMSIPGLFALDKDLGIYRTMIPTDGEDDDE